MTSAGASPTPMTPRRAAGLAVLVPAVLVATVAALGPAEAAGRPGRAVSAGKARVAAAPQRKRRYFYYRRYANPAIVKARQGGAAPPSQLKW